MIGVPESISDSVFMTPQGETVTEKECSHCHYFKPLIAFHRKGRGKYGRQEWCKRCMKNKPFATWEEEQAEDRAKQQAKQNGNGAVGNPTPVNQETHVQPQPVSINETASVAYPPEDINAVLDVETEITTTEHQFALEPGQMEFADWLESDSPVFSTPLVTVIKHNGDSDKYFTVYTNVGVDLPPYVTVGEVNGSKMAELIVRVIGNNISGKPNVYGFTYA